MRLRRRAIVKARPPAVGYGGARQAVGPLAVIG